MPRFIWLCLVCFGVLITASTASGAIVTLKVIPSQGGNSPTDNIYTTIQEAINASSPTNSTTIEVYDKGSPYKLHDATELGDEPAHLNFNGKEDIRMVGHGGTIVIDGNGNKGITIPLNDPRRLMHIGH